MRRMNPIHTGAHRLALALLVGATGLAGHGALAADSNPPPPGLPPAGDPLIPKRARVLFQTVVHPGYLDWLGTSAFDSVATFHGFLLTQPMSDADRFHYLQLYLELNR